MSPQPTASIAGLNDDNGKVSDAITTQAANEAFAAVHRNENPLRSYDSHPELCTDSDPSANGIVTAAAYASRLILRKRKVSFSDASAVPLASRVSASFLSGIFADINNAAIDSQAKSPTPFEENYVSDFPDSCPSSPAPCKKSRISMTRSMSRSPKSYRSLGAALFGEELPAVPPLCASTDSYATGKSTSYLTEDPLDKILAGVDFPHLPATVSESSCSSTNLTQVVKSSGRNASGPETSAAGSNKSGESNESYGWFVAMEEEDDEKANCVSDACKKSRSMDLAFCAATAPKRVDDDDEVQWAQAADTVDSVLGDFF